MVRVNIREMHFNNRCIILIMAEDGFRNLADIARRLEDELGDKLEGIDWHSLASRLKADAALDNTSNIILRKLDDRESLEEWEREHVIQLGEKMGGKRKQGLETKRKTTLDEFTLGKRIKKRPK